MSYNNDERIKLSVKSSNFAIASKFSTTENDIQMYLVANNCNLYNWNNQDSGAIFGAELVNVDTDNEHHEPYIAITHGEKKKLAQFNNDLINLNRDVTIDGTLKTSNLRVLGDTTFIETNSYQT